MFRPYCQPSDLSPTIAITSPSVNDNWLSTSAVKEYKACTCAGGRGAAVLGGNVFAGNKENTKLNCGKSDCYSVEKEDRSLIPLPI